MRERFIFLFIALTFAFSLLCGCASSRANLDAGKFTLDIGEFTDNRDGKIYKTTKIGEQIWMAENLNYNESTSVCYDNKVENCEKYGRLYNWETAMKICPNGWHLSSKEEWNILIGNVDDDTRKFRKINSWRSEYSLRALLQLIAISNGMLGLTFCGILVDSPNSFQCYLAAGVISLSFLALSFIPSSVEQINDSYGFSALPSGYAESNKKFKGMRYWSSWWNTGEEDSDNAYYKTIHFSQPEAIEGYYDKSFLLHVRCVMD